MRKFALLFVLILSLVLTNACKNEEDIYPSLITNLADCHTDNEGNMTIIELDDESQYVLKNPQPGLHANSTYRCLCGYTADGDKATLYTLSGAYFLRDSTQEAVKDPIDIVSVWKTDKYINLHLSAKTQGGKQYWGYVTDSIRGQHAYISLHHRQNGDPCSYSTDIYASIALDSIPATTITLQNRYEYTK